MFYDVVRIISWLNLVYIGLIATGTFGSSLDTKNKHLNRAIFIVIFCLAIGVLK